MIEVRYLRLIDAVSTFGSLKGAADYLCVTQSALSHQLKEFETHLGVPIFHRSNNQLHFTAAGKRVLEESQFILSRLQDLETDVRKIAIERLDNYIHGYSEFEAQRLNDQASTIADLLHRDSTWEAGSLVLEAGCGVGAQTKIICQKNPNCDIISIDLSEKSLSIATEMARESGFRNVQFQKADVLNLPFPDQKFDHVFVCFVLEHLAKPLSALTELKRILKTGGTISVIEGDHGSTYFYPDNLMANKAVEAQVALQKSTGGNANIGRELYPLLSQAGFNTINVSPRTVYIDESKPDMVEGFIKNTFTAMIKGIADDAVSKNIISKAEMDAGIKALLKTAEKGGTFHYTFFKAVACK
ncbi:methyltransferase domain-containing protein [Ohtaekwangia koreensis]|uniref:Regulatory helix-turn-helix protein, lysR family n=1 Tax=Ohtaekwangia koreensis TaxID=688867 RepID=A0A1T5KLE6_9BACT|nr:methyltransferase domain-containing protein [Ohtaekwangia koreensis]SKC64098.1 regulatory helix-turn-helix protein, lysR family [Ohtaekwangia koreensis]